MQAELSSRIQVEEGKWARWCQRSRGTGMDQSNTINKTVVSQLQPCSPAKCIVLALMIG